MIKMLDAGWPASTPAGVIADAKALGAGVVALYDADWSAPGANKTAAFLAAVDAGVPVIPICTPSNVPPDSASELLAIMVSQGLTHKFCMFDLEQYSFPPQAWVSACIALLHGAGWKVIGYGFQSTKNTYWGCGFDYWVGVIDYAEQYGYVPPWCDGLQYYDKLIGPSGATYDGSTLSDALATAFFADPAHPPIQGETMAIVVQGDGVDPNHGKGAVYLLGEFKQYLAYGWQTGFYTAHFGPVVPIPQAVLDRVVEIQSIPLNQTAPIIDLEALSAEVSAISKKVGA